MECPEKTLFPSRVGGRRFRGASCEMFLWEGHLRRKPGRKRGRKRDRKHFRVAGSATGSSGARRAARARPGRPRRRAARSLTPPGALGGGGGTRAAAARAPCGCSLASCRKRRRKPKPRGASCGASCAGVPPAGTSRRKRREIALRAGGRPLTGEVRPAGRPHYRVGPPLRKQDLGTASEFLS